MNKVKRMDAIVFGANVIVCIIAIVYIVFWGRTPIAEARGIRFWENAHTVYHDKVFYRERGNLYGFDLNGENGSKIGEFDLRYNILATNGGTLYWSNDDGVWSYDIENQSKRQLCKEKLWKACFYEGYIYGFILHKGYVKINVTNGDYTLLRASDGDNFDFFVSDSECFFVQDEKEVYLDNDKEPVIELESDWEYPVDFADKDIYDIEVYDGTIHIFRGRDVFVYDENSYELLDKKTFDVREHNRIMNVSEGVYFDHYDSENEEFSVLKYNFETHKMDVIYRTAEFRFCEAVYYNEDRYLIILKTYTNYTSYTAVLLDGESEKILYEDVMEHQINVDPEQKVIYYTNTEEKIIEKVEY